MKTGKVMLGLGLILGVAMLYPAGPVKAQQSKPAEIAFGHGFMLETPHHKASLRFKELVEQRSNGRIKVNVFPAGQLGSAKDMFEGLQMGSQQIALLPTARISGFNPKLQLFDLPFLFPNREIAYKVFDGPFGAELLKTLEGNKIVGIAFYEDGFKHFTCSKPIGKPEDFKGTKFRTMESPIIMEQFRSLGANPTPIDFGELYNALQQKVVDGQENPLVTIFNMKFYEVQKYLILSSHAYLGHVLMYSKSWYDGLPKDLQKILADTGRELAPWQRNGVMEGEGGYLKKIKEFGTHVTEFSDSEKARMREATRPVYKVAEGIIGKDLIDKAGREIDRLSKK
jgi:C4-dicarboxylate-binding protein DctP